MAAATGFGSTTAVIEVDDLYKSYRDTLALAGLSFQLHPSQVLALVGPNGAGKTTTMRLIAGLLQATSGAVRVCGRDVRLQPVEAKRCLAYIPDDPQLFSDLTVDQHMAFTAGAYDVQEAQSKTEVLLEQFELTTRRSTRARDLSRGMRQKLAICCAYLHQPQVLLCDEPMTGLDPEGIRTWKSSLQLRAQEGAAVIVSSHLLAMLEDISTHVLVLDEGDTRFWGTLAQFKQAYDHGDGASLEDSFFRATMRTPAIAVGDAGQATMAGADR